MNKLRFLALLNTALCMVKETPVDTVGLADNLAHFYNGIKRHDGWHLKNGASGSIVNFKNKNTIYDEWSFEVVIQEPALVHPEFAGVYLWYTDEPIKHGSYKGAEGAFNGVLAGVEFVGKSWDIVVSSNHGEHDYTGLREEDTELKDSPDPAILKGQKEITLKVISTSKNFKIEVYGDSGKLLYDKVRYTEMSEIGTRLSGKYFGLSTEYHQISPSKSVVLKSVKFSSREEGEEYDPQKSHAEIPEYVPRVPHEVGHGSEEIQHTIAGIEHLTKYLRIVLGEPQSKPVADNVVYLKKTINFQSAHILELRDGLRAIAEIGKKHTDNENHHREEIMRTLRGIQAELQSKEEKPEGSTAHSKITVLNLLLFCAISFAGGYFVAQRMHYARKIAMH